MEVRVRSVVIFFGLWGYQKEQKWIQTHLLPHYMHLNLECGCEVTVQNWSALQSVQIPHSGSKTEESEEFLSSDKFYPFHIPQFLCMLINCFDSSPPPEFRHLKKGACMVAKKPWCLAGHPHVFKPPPWGWCKPGELPSGNAMDSCSCRDSGLPSTMPHSAVVSSHGQTGSALSPPKSITLVSNVEIERCLEELTPARVNPMGLCLSLSHANAGPTHPKGWALWFIQFWVIYSKVSLYLIWESSFQSWLWQLKWEWGTSRKNMWVRDCV